MNKALSKNGNCQPDVLRLPNGELTSSRKEAVEHLLKVHFPGCKFNEPFNGNAASEETAASSSFSQQTSWEIARRVVTPELVDWSVRSFSPYKAGGPDNIFPAEIQHGFVLLQDHLIALFTACIALGYIPKEWTRVRVVFIPKVGKSNYWDAKSFRPISLTSALLKVLERLVDMYIRNECLTIHKLCDKQHAYLAGKSCETALHQLVSQIERALDLKECVVGTFIDIEGAFDNTSYQSITDACLRHGIDPHIITWIETMLRTRTIEMDVDNERIVVNAIQGCPQGGVLSPLMWILVVDDLLVKLNQAGFPTQAYADDLVITISGKFIHTLLELTQNAIQIVEDWCSETGLAVNPSKTEMVVFTKKRKMDGLVIPKLAGQQITVVDQVKYLGVILDRKLSWAPHLNAKVNKAVNAFWQVRRYFGQTWGLSPKMLYYLYTSFVRPMFAYASLVWWPRVKLKTSIAKLNHLQRIACLAITGAMSTTPTLAMEAILSIPPLDSYILAAASSAAFRLNCSDAWNVRGKAVGHLMIWDNIKSQIPNIEMHTDYIKSEFDFNLPYSFLYPSREWWGTEESKLMIMENVAVFTDGSVSERGSGYGVYSPSLKVAISGTLGKISTIFQVELAAILCCAFEALQFKLKNKHIIVFTDSLSVLHALESPKVSSKLIRDCKEAFLQLSNHNKVTLGWVPSHSGVAGNEIADELARSGAKETYFGPDPAVGLSLATGKKMIKQWMIDQLVERWSTVTSCRQTKMYLQRPSKNLSRYALSLKKRDLKILVQILTGHGKFNVHLRRMEVKCDSLCEFCLEDDDDAEHFICKCPAFTCIRKKFLSSEFLAKEQLRCMSWTKILSFCKASDRFLENE